jgi:membrane protein DedA with SNARE-associated domain
VRFLIFILGALVAGIGFIGMYVGLSYFLGAEIAMHIGNVGTKAVIGVIVVVVIGLVIRAGVAKWRATRRARQAQAELPQVRATSD